MAATPGKSRATWSDIKARLADLDRTNLLGLVHDLYAASKDNRTFLHARFGLGDDVLKPYKITIDRWLWPDVRKNQDTSVSKAKKAITDYKKAIGKPEELAELMVFYCEHAVGFCNAVGLDDDGYYYAIVTCSNRRSSYQQLCLSSCVTPCSPASMLSAIPAATLATG